MARAGQEKGKGCLWCLYRGGICNHIYLSIDSIASMFVVFAARCHCVSPRMFPSYWSPSAASPAPGVSVSLLSPPLMKHRPPLETDVVTQSLVTAHRMHDISHSIKEDFNGSDLFYSLEPIYFHFTFCVFTFIAIVSDMKMQLTSLIFSEKCLLTDYWKNIFTICPLSFCKIGNFQIWN